MEKYKVIILFFLGIFTIFPSFNAKALYGLLFAVRFPPYSLLCIEIRMNYHHFNVIRVNAILDSMAFVFRLQSCRFVIISILTILLHL